MDKRRMCPHCRAFITTDDRVCPYCENVVGPRQIDRRSPAPIFGGLIPHARFITVMILLVNFALYIAMTLSSMQAGNNSAISSLDVRTLFNFGAKSRQAIFAGQWWRLVTAGFLHGGIVHILMNSWVLFDVGASAEEMYGASRLIVIYFVSTVTGFLVSAYWSPAISVGASAPIMGLIGAMIALGMRSTTPMGSAIRGFYIRWAIFGLVLGLMPGVDNAAHLGGIAGGFLVGYIAGAPKLVNNWAEKFWRAASGVSLALTAYCFLQMFLWLLGSQ
ncbi:MAG: rhomboid family intramembrane serine protease [Bryobacteraceae bacterium]